MKVPKEEFKFLDQRTMRKIKIGGIDIKATRALRKRKKCKKRKFKLPKVYFHAKNYTDCIDWSSNKKKTEPPSTKEYPDDTYQDIINGKTLPVMQKLLFHTQNVERCVKMVTEASQSIIGAENRETALLEHHYNLEKKLNL